MKTGSLTIGKGKSRLQLFYSQLAPNIFFIDENILLVVLKRNWEPAVLRFR
ncbi:MAG: hypothetical protein WDO19_14315 [Bacteroidota bacterium]